MMQQNSQLQCAEDGRNSSHLPLNSLRYETNSAIPHMYSVPPPNMYIPPYFHYSGNYAPTFATSQHTDVLVPPYPPPEFQNVSFPTPNSIPFPQHQVHVNMPLPLQLELQGNCSLQGTFVRNMPAHEFEIQKFKKNGVSDDALWIESWLSKRNGRSEEGCSDMPVKIGNVKETFKKCINLLQELKNLEEEMQAGYKNINVTTWNSLCQNFKNKKDSVSDYILNMPDMKRLQKSITKRHRKRECRNRKNKERKENRMNNNENRQVLHHKIDTWLKVMQERIDRNKREESLKKEADSVLSEVLRKKADGRRQLALVASLLKLRQLRAKSAANRGQHVPTDDGVRFEKVAENLKVLWDKQLLEYNVEEQGMRVMLSEAVDERDQSQVSRERQILSQWDKLLFGTKPCDFPEFYVAAEKNIGALISIRQSWDKFIVSNRASVQSNIPVGWILPNNPSSLDWEALLSSDKLEH